MNRWCNCGGDVSIRCDSLITTPNQIGGFEPVQCATGTPMTNSKIALQGGFGDFENEDSDFHIRRFTPHPESDHMW